jgi:hypothetical protein
MKSNRPTLPSSSTQNSQKKVTKRVAPAQIDNTSISILENPMNIYITLAKQMKGDFGDEEEKQNDQYIDSDSSSEEEELPELDPEVLGTHNPKILREKQMEREKIRQDQKNYKLWRKKKGKSYFGKCQVCMDDSLSSCQHNFGYVMLALMLIAVAFMFYMKMGQETFSIQDQAETVDYYTILEIEKNATPSEIKKAYRKRAIKYHPDRNPNCGQKCTDKMNELTEAYIVMSNPDTKQFHDRFGVKPPQQLMDLAKARHGGRGAFKTD